MKDWTANEVILVLGAFTTLITTALVPAVISIIKEIKELKSLTTNNHKTNVSLVAHNAYNRAMVTQDPRDFQLLEEAEKALKVAKNPDNKLNDPVTKS